MWVPGSPLLNKLPPASCWWKSQGSAATAVPRQAAKFLSPNVQGQDTRWCATNREMCAHLEGPSSAPLQSAAHRRTAAQNTSRPVIVSLLGLGEGAHTDEAVDGRLACTQAAAPLGPLEGQVRRSPYALERNRLIFVSSMAGSQEEEMQCFLLCGSARSAKCAQLFWRQPHLIQWPPSFIPLELTPLKGLCGRTHPSNTLPNSTGHDAVQHVPPKSNQITSVHKRMQQAQVTPQGALYAQ